PGSGDNVKPAPAAADSNKRFAASAARDAVSSSGTGHTRRWFIVHRSAMSQFPGSIGSDRKWQPMTSAPRRFASPNVVPSAALHSGRSATGIVIALILYYLS